MKPAASILWVPQYLEAAQRFFIEMDHEVDVEPFKATYFVSEVVQNNVLKRRGIACAVFYKDAILLLTSSSAVEETDNEKKLIAERFSSKHFGDYRLEVSFFRQCGSFTFLRIVKEHKFGRMGRSWVISLNLESPSSETKSATPFCGRQDQKIKLEFKRAANRTTIEVISGKTVDRTSILGAPIVIERNQMNKKHSGRFAVVGVVGLTSEDKLCPYYWDLSDENTRSLGEFCLVCPYYSFS